MAEEEVLKRVLQVKRQYEKVLLARANVVGVGVGFKTEHGQPTDTLAVVVNVTHKRAVAELAREDLLPAELDGVPVDVQEVGQIKAL
jgi:hypothetical protein